MSHVFSVYKYSKSQTVDFGWVDPWLLLSASGCVVDVDVQEGALKLTVHLVVNQGMIPPLQ